MQFYDQIRKNNIEDYGKKIKSWIPIIINQYSDRTHFIYEILQNAEDADATQISFNLYKDKIEIYHNGRPFNEKDIKGVSGIADGTKDDGSRIGHFGIGFKAVYGYTESPCIYSGKYHFEIKDFVNPYEIEAKKNLDEDITCLILPFNKENVTKETAFAEIREALLEKITAESILMLSHISEVDIKVEDINETIHISKEVKPLDDSGNVYGLNLLTINGNMQVEKDYLYFTDAEKEATVIIFRVDTSNKELLEVKNSKIFAFFPTAKEAHQNFYIHAPFDTTPARDNFKEGADFGKHNLVLVERIGELIQYAFNWLRDNGYLSFSGFNKVFPTYEYEKSDVLYGIYKKSVEIISSGEKLIPTNIEGVYKSINEVCVPENMGIVSVFEDGDLQRLFENRKIYWISKEITTTAFSDLKRFFDDNFDLKTYFWRDLVLKIDSDYLRTKDITWLERLTSSIESFCIKRPNNTHYIDVTNIPFVRLQSGEYVTAKKDGNLQVYLNNPAVVKLKIDTEYLNNESIRSFYERALLIPVYDIEREVLDKILPKYATRNVTFKTKDHIKENIEDLKEIKTAIFNNSSITELVASSYIVTDGEDWYLPSELYIKSTDDDERSGYSLVKDIIQIKYLSDLYFDNSLLTLKLDEDLFSAIGCSKGLREINVTKEEYREAVTKYLGKAEWINNYANIINKRYISQKFDYLFSYEAFSKVFSNMSDKKSLAIARFANSHYMHIDIKGELVGANDQHFSGKDVDSVMAYSMIGLILCFEKWIYIKGVAEPQRPVDVDKEDLLPSYKPFKRILGILPFKEVKNELSKYLESIYSNKGDVDLIKGIISDPEELLNLAKAKLKSDAKKAAVDEKRGSLAEQLERADRKQKEIQKEQEFPEASPIPEKGMEKREEKLEELFKESLDQKLFMAKGVQFSRWICSPGEREFLYEQYSGFCQICRDTIPKYDGDNYFEAINILKTSDIYINYLSRLDTGWNSLCLCPNCAAKYNYSSKVISSMYEQIRTTNIIPGSNEYIKIGIELPEKKPAIIHYTSRHFMALKKAFEIFEEG